MVVGMLLVAFLPVMPANAERDVIGITISEQITRHDTYQPTAAFADGTVVAGAVSGSGTITLANNAGIPLYDVSIVFDAGYTTNWAQAPGDTTAATITGAGPVTVAVKNFPAGASVHLTYDLDSSAVPPVTLSATYTRNSITNNAASSTTIHLTATCNGASLPSDVASVTPTITITSADNAVRGTVGTPDWALSSTSTTPAAGSPLTWAPGAIVSGASSGPIDIVATVNDVDALNDGNSVSLYDVATSEIAYTITSNAGSSAGVRVISATGSTAEVVSTIDKQFVSGQWQFTPKVSTPGASTIAYDLTSITEWAVATSDLNTAIAGPTMINTANHDSSHPTWPVLVDGSNPFTAAGNEVLTFAYSGIPVGFMKPAIAIRDTSTQFPKTATSTANGVDLLKRVYVINGYQVEVVKTITPSATAGQYHINIVATNLGTVATPPTVVVYDIVPSAFYSTSGATITSPFNRVPEFTGHTSVTGGEAFYWNIGTLAANGQPGDHATIDYDVTGTGSYTTSDLFVVGVDPAQSLNLQSTPSLSNAATMVNANFEALAALGAAGLLVIGMIGTARRRL